MKIQSISFITEQIKSCLEKGEIPAAFYMALTLPDACGKLEFPNSTPGERYIKWFDEHIGQFEQSPLVKEDPSWADMPYLSGENIYRIRNGLLHACTNDVGDQMNLDDFLFIWDGAVETSGIEADFKGTTKRYWHVNVRMIIDKILAVVEWFLKNGSYNRSSLPIINVYDIEDISPVLKIKKV